ncbi:uncharacterized protein N7459_002640 [Penicillium hispanicum]|uniref:uncharacterized protein n=1 Tax=Penicillium hispanicum TaxID=1080232 RepID=UPI0025426467|nr:uncharacterized protein N7459_002640 [Penicillium hispanicum]KAJ5586875.1 hypothetical protein N7459_002640 [Penicillium hispanicum]
MVSPAGIKTRICMISDTHTCPPNPSQFTSYAYRAPLPEADVLLHAGDLTKVGYQTEHKTMVSMLKTAPAELKLVIAGNHDITLDEEHFTSFGYRRQLKSVRLGHSETLLENDATSLVQTIRNSPVPLPDTMKTYVRSIKDLYTNDAARAAGIHYLDEGTHTFTLSSGAQLTVYASPYQPEFCRWAFAYPRSQDRFNPPLPGSTRPAPQNPVPDFPAVDIMLTHGPPAGVLDGVGRDPVTHVGCGHLLRAAERARPRLYLFGHIHEGWGAVRGTWDSFASGGIRQESIDRDQEEMLEKRGAFYDVSAQSERPLRVGAETLFVNASICTLSYQPLNAPWVVDLDLPCAEEQVKPE